MAYTEYRREWEAAYASRTEKERKKVRNGVEEGSACASAEGEEERVAASMIKNRFHEVT